MEDERLRNSVQASEQERRRWARELHDETLQELGALKVLLEGARQSERPHALTEAIDRAVEQIQLSISGLQGLITELRPAALDELGTGPALDALIKRTAATSGLDIQARGGPRLRAGPQLRPVTSAEVESAIFRLVQESLTNVVKHAEAERVEIDVSEEDGRITVASKTTGAVSIRRGAARASACSGCASGSRSLGGELSVESTPGAGTTVTASFPATLAGSATPAPHWTARAG